ncbi:5-carboxymethyl-2-hydroxymuconate Delta-isomerase [Chromobacterium sp.]|uniref:5-carboxymethyl-2-hydroxymuconate Delta-isomerase n=1 Tax=Chromobacterium sp. TaxID=306190 RepID=UPI0035AF32C3
MPHFTVECTDNLREQADLPGLFRQVHDCLAASGLYPLAGIRSRAHWLDTWRMADGEADYAFVHCRLQIGSGRSETQRRATAEQVFALIQRHFEPLFAQRYLALSFELTELSATLNFKHNNVHQRFRQPS